LLLVIAFLNYHLADSAKRGTPPNPKIMKTVPFIARTSLAIVLIGIAVVTTN
jgi:hypothetical protein